MKTDMQLKQDVLTELDWEPSVNAAHIGVSINDGVVTLTGHVPSFAEKHAAEKAAKRVYGIKAVADEIDVKLPSSSRRTDGDIATTCVKALKDNETVPDQRIKILVDSGRVTLEGEVEWQYQKDAALASIRYLAGVAGVTNCIRIKPRVSPADVKTMIEQALKRSAQEDARRISVKVEGAKVILHGSVRSLSEKDEAGWAAWAAPGIVDVKNDLSVTP
jgi:osmotically-inducible protein OsmY